MLPPSLEYHEAPYRGHGCVTYHRINGLTVCPFAEEDPDWDATIEAWPVTWHVVYVRTRVAVDFGSIKGFIGEREGVTSIVEETVSDLVAELRNPVYELAAACVAAEERHDGNFSRDVALEEYRLSSSLCSASAIHRYDTLVDTILRGGARNE